MRRGPRGERRPADVNALAVMIAKVATGEIEDVQPTAESEARMQRLSPWDACAGRPELKA